MTYYAKIIADSIAMNEYGKPISRLTTMEVCFPRIVLAEFNTHRVFSRNSASSRAIPVAKRIAAVRKNPFVPEAFGRNQKGMQAGEAIGGWQALFARFLWLGAAGFAVFIAWCMSKIDVHKQIANRILEPFSWHTVVVTSTEWENYFALRCSLKAQPEIRIVSELMENAFNASMPREKYNGGWHLPYVRDEEIGAPYGERKLAEISTARSARLSYLTQDGRRDLAEDFRLHDSLLGSHHMSPLEHPAQVDWEDARLSNFAYPWTQYRKMIPGEAIAHRE